MKARSGLVVGTAVAILFAGAVPAVAGDRKREAKKAPAAVAPANDAFTMGTEITEMPFQASVDLRGASIEANRYQTVAVASSAPVGIAIHSGADLATLSEVACATAAPQAHIAMPATAATTYFVQVSVPKRRKAPVTFSLKVDTWRQHEIANHEWVVPVPAVDQATVVIDGKAREDKPGIYDLTIKAGDVTVGPYGVETNPVKLPPIHQELVKVPGQTVNVAITSSYRYDSAQGRCVLYQGEECVEMLPVAGESSWYTSGEGAEAELLVTLKITKNDKLLAERTVAVPYVGQVAGLLP